MCMLLYAITTFNAQALIGLLGFDVAAVLGRLVERSFGLG